MTHWCPFIHTILSAEIGIGWAGGLIMFIRNTYRFVRKREFEMNNIELMWVEIQVDSVFLKVNLSQVYMMKVVLYLTIN